jgi:NADH dehydrogenase
MPKQKITADILILGAGIGGYEVFKKLNIGLKKSHLNKTITIVDQNNYFTFTPLLHEVASGSIEPPQAVLSLREIIYKTPHHFLKSKVLKINPKQRMVITEAAEITYEYCVMSLGSSVNFYGITGTNENCYTVRTMTEALRLRRDIIKKLDACRSDLSISIIGGGYTGVEVAGQMAHLANWDLKKLYPETKIKINLIQASATVVPQLPKKAQTKIINRLKNMGVEIFFNAGVKKITTENIILPDKEITSDITIWSAGVENMANKFLEQNMCEKGQIPVNEFLQHRNFTSLYGVGDIICGTNVGETSHFPQIGEAAYHQGQYVAQHLLAVLKQKKCQPFNFQSRGTLMPIGDNYGIGVFGKMVIDGFFIWWLRRTVYVLFMPGFLRKLKLVINWTLNLFGFRYFSDIN